MLSGNGRRVVFAFTAFLAASSSYARRFQNPSRAAQSPEPQSSSSSAGKTQTQGRHQHDFLIKGTVFTPEGLSYPAATIRIRRDGENSFHWHDQTNSRGEFAIRVVQGAKYDVQVTAKGSKPENKSVDASGAERVAELVFHLQREGNTK